MLAQLGRLEVEIRERHGVGETLQEQLDQAVAAEDYETAAAAAGRHPGPANRELRRGVIRLTARRHSRTSNRS